MIESPAGRVSVKGHGRKNEMIIEIVGASMAQTTRVGIVGAKFAARFHYPALRRVYGVPVEIVGVTAKSRESAEAFARERGLKTFVGFEELCEACDVVDLCSPDRKSVV